MYESHKALVRISLMPFLIDGNNVMAQTAGPDFQMPSARRRLIRDIASFIAVKRAKVKVVFDGVPDDRFPDGTKYKSVHVLYAKPGSDADTRIKEIVRKASYRRDLVVVSSDREIVSYAKAKGAQTMASEEFRKLIRRTHGDAPEKPPDNEPVDVDDWLRYFNSEDV